MTQPPTPHSPNDMLATLRQTVSADPALCEQLLESPSLESAIALLQAALRAAGQDYPVSAIAACLHAPAPGAAAVTTSVTEEALSDQTLDTVAGGRGGQEYSSPWGPLVPVIYSVALCPESQKGELDPNAIIKLGPLLQ